MCVGVGALFLPLRLAFWVFLVGFIISGGKPSPDPVNRPQLASPIQESAQVVTDAAYNLRNICEDYQAVCVIAGQAGALALDFGQYFTGRIHQWLAERGEQVRQGEHVS